MKSRPWYAPPSVEHAVASCGHWNTEESSQMNQQMTSEVQMLPQHIAILSIRVNTVNSNTMLATTANSSGWFSVNMEEGQKASLKKRKVYKNGRRTLEHTGNLHTWKKALGFFPQPSSCELIHFGSICFIDTSLCCPCGMICLVAQGSNMGPLCFRLWALINFTLSWLPQKNTEYCHLLVSVLLPKWVMEQQWLLLPIPPFICLSPTCDAYNIPTTHLAIVANFIVQETLDCTLAIQVKGC